MRNCDKTHKLIAELEQHILGTDKPSYEFLLEEMEEGIKESKDDYIGEEDYKIMLFNLLNALVPSIKELRQDIDKREKVLGDIWKSMKKKEKIIQDLIQQLEEDVSIQNKIKGYTSKYDINIR